MPANNMFLRRNLVYKEDDGLYNKTTCIILLGKTTCIPHILRQLIYDDPYGPNAIFRGPKNSNSISVELQ